MNPAKVFCKCSFEDVIAFAVENKEKQEFRERFNNVWQSINGGHSSGSDTGG
jgi:hypothetical protein